MMPIAFGMINARRLAVAIAASLPLLSGPAQATQLYDTTHVLQQQGNACVGATGCKVIESKSRRIKPGAAADITAYCPDARPFLVNWDASHHEHIGIRQSERKPRKVTVVAINHADTPGRVTLYLGCATKDPGRTPELKSVEALPSKALKGIRR
jgi:hypothetical protein